MTKLSAAERIERAEKEVIRLCGSGPGGQRDKSFRMTVPAEPDRDSDLVLMDGLAAGREALATLDAAPSIDVEALTSAIDDALSAMDDEWTTDELAEVILARLTKPAPQREAPCGRCGSDWHYTDEHEDAAQPAAPETARVCAFPRCGLPERLHGAPPGEPPNPTRSTHRFQPAAPETALNERNEPRHANEFPPECGEAFTAGYLWGQRSMEAQPAAPETERLRETLETLRTAMRTDPADRFWEGWDAALVAVEVAVFPSLTAYPAASERLRYDCPSCREVLAAIEAGDGSEGQA